MKTVTQDYIDLEEAATRKPVEIYKIWWGTTYWYYTSGDVAVVYDSNTYNPATIQRGPVKYNSDFNVSQLDINFGRATDPVIDFIVSNPVEIIWVEVSRLFRDQSPYEKSVIFIGQLKTVTTKGVAMKASCVGFEFFLKQPIPIQRYQPQCNAKLFDTKCGLAKTSYDLPVVSVAVSSDGLTITHANFSSQADGYWKWGYLEFEGHERMIVSHAGTSVVIRYKIDDLETGDDLTIYAGCDLSIATCETKFSNHVNFRGHPYIPIDNPCLWT